MHIPHDRPKVNHKPLLVFGLYPLIQFRLTSSYFFIDIGWQSNIKGHVYNTQNGFCKMARYKHMLCCFLFVTKTTTFSIS